MSLRIFCFITTLCSVTAIQGISMELGADGSLARRETLPTGARSFTDELALLQGHASAPSSLLQAESLDTSCELPSGGRWCTARSGGKTWQMAVYAGPDPVSNTICQTGFWEHGDPTNLGVPSGSNQLLDIGANVGWYTFMFAQNGYNVLAVEPMTANRALIKATMCQNPKLASKIKVVAAALTDKVDKPGQKCSIFSANINLGDGLVACGDQQIAELRNKAHNNAQIQHIEREQVPLTTLDEVLASSNLKNIDVMKMDVERYECHVLDGAATLFTRFHPKGLMIETRSSGKKEDLKPGQIGSTTDCTVKAVMKGGNYKIHEDNIAGKVVPEPTGAGVFNLYFSLNEASLLQAEDETATADKEATEEEIVGEDASEEQDLDATKVEEADKEDPDEEEEDEDDEDTTEENTED